MESVVSPEEVVSYQSTVRAVHVEPAAISYAVALVDATRRDPQIALGASPRSAVALTRCAQARAVAVGRDFVLPDDIKLLAPAVLAHRLVARRSSSGAEVGREVVRKVLGEVPVPLGLAGRG